jgi:hypothetical protein
MKKMLITLALVASHAFAPNHALSDQTNLVQNGSFEVGYSYSGWTLASGGLFNLGGPGTGVQSADGFNAIGLGWQSTFYQNVPTAAGQQYVFSFFIAQLGPDAGPANVVSLQPSFGGTSLGTANFSGAGHTDQSMGWQKFDYTVTATSISSQISFFNPGTFISDNRWPMIDNVSLTSIPEPTTNALLVLTGAMVLSRCRQSRAPSLGR